MNLSVQSDKDHGNTYFGLGKYEQALSCYTNAILQNHPETTNTKKSKPEQEEQITLLSNRAAVYLRLERPMLAMLDCNAILEQDSTHAKALFRRATAFELMGSYASSLQDLRALLDLEPNETSELRIRTKITLVRSLRDAANSVSTTNTKNNNVDDVADVDAKTNTTIQKEQNEEEDDEDDDDDDDEDDEDDANQNHQVQLGFLEELSPEDEDDCLYPLLHLDKNWKHWEGGKVGGRPIWLNPIDLPNKEMLQCAACGQQMNMLMQIYAPIDTNGADVELTKRAFHRSLYVFCCRNGKCMNKSHKSNKSNTSNTSSGSKTNANDSGDYQSNTNMNGLCVLRCQMQQQNDYYEMNPLDSDSEEDNDNEQKNQVQVDSEKNATTTTNKKDFEQHFEQRNTPSNNHATALLVHDMPFTEHEVVTESEQECKEQSDAVIMASVNNVSTLNADNGDMTAKSTREAMSVLNDNGDGTTSTLISAMDANMIKFQTVTSIASDQVLRYSRWDTRGPLWVSNKNTLVAENIPICEHCHGPRCFEFQIMPQVLNALKPHEIGGVGEIDWGTLAVYTCAKSCIPVSQNATSYVKEYVYRQAME